MTAKSSQSARKNLIGKRFGRLRVIGPAFAFIEADGSKKKAWMCHCDCGNTTRVREYTLLNGRTTSCRCFQKERARARFTTHGMTKTRVYSIWQGIKSRINDPNDINYPHYGARGIRICQRWERSFANFLKDMGMPPTNLHSIERLDNEKGYFPKNCAWIPRSEQNRNKRNSRMVEFNGVKKCIAAWAEELGLPYITLHSRLTRGVPVEKALVSKRYSRWTDPVCSA